LKQLAEDRYTIDEFFAIYLQGHLNIDVPKEEPKVQKQTKKKQSSDKKGKNKDTENETDEEETTEGIRRSARIAGIKTTTTSETTTQKNAKESPKPKEKREQKEKLHEYRLNLNIVQTLELCGQTCTELAKTARNLSTCNVETTDWIKLANELKKKAMDAASKLKDAKSAIDIQYPQHNENDNTGTTDNDSEDDSDSDSEWSNEEPSNEKNEPNDITTISPNTPPETIETTDLTFEEPTETIDTTVNAFEEVADEDPKPTEDDNNNNETVITATETDEHNITANTANTTTITQEAMDEDERLIEPHTEPSNKKQKLNPTTENIEQDTNNPKE